MLGPSLFLLYVNDLYKSSNKFHFYFFADDTSVTYANRDLKTLESEFNEELSKVCMWLTVNKLTLNAEKSNYIILHPRQKTLSFHPNIRIIDSNSNTSQPLEMKITLNILVYSFIDSNLSWKFHIDYICQKVSKTIPVMYFSPYTAL